MALSCFIITLILNGFTVKFDMNESSSINVVISKDGITMQHIVEMPDVTSGNDVSNMLYETLTKAYADYNMVINKCDCRKE